MKEERAVLSVNPEMPGNEKIAGNILKITGLSIQKRISKWCRWQDISSVLLSFCSDQSTEIGEKARIPSERVGSPGLETLGGAGYPSIPRNVCPAHHEAALGATTSQAFGVPS